MKGLHAVSAAAAICASALLLVACGGSGVSNDELNEARMQGAAKAHQQAKIAQIQKELKALRHGGHGAPAPESGSAPAPETGSSGTSGNCGGGLSANEYTTCGFAENVESDYYAEVGSGAGTIDSYSPTTHRSYTMYCTAGEPHECTGGNEAAVFFP
jgi:hypothetical protein